MASPRAHAARERGSTTNLGNQIMRRFLPNRGLAAALAIVFSMASLSAARADISDYEFRLVETEIEQGEGAIVAVELVDVRSGSAVPDAVIFASRIDMAPDGMPTMTAPIAALPSTEAGIYRFKTDLTMAGGWQLSLAAKVQGESGTLENKLILRVVP